MGYENCVLVDYLRAFGHEVQTSLEKLNLDVIRLAKYDFLISYGYSHIVSAQILDLFPHSAVNLHISFLPHNRGSDPNFWSFVEDSPKGVSIHYMSAGLDKGEIIAQRRLDFDQEFETFSSSYLRLRTEIETLFMSVWQGIVNHTCPHAPQSPGGSYHKSADKEKYMSFLKNGWNSRVCEVLEAIKTAKNQI